jgi:hypothetical protein
MESNLEEINFEEVTEDSVYDLKFSFIRRGRCENFFCRSVGSNSLCGCCKIVKNKDYELFRCLKAFT